CGGASTTPEFERKPTAADEWMHASGARRYTSSAASALCDGVHKHAPCPLMTTTGMQRQPGVQVRHVAGSPTVSRSLRWNPGFKVLWHASPRRRMYPHPGARAEEATAPFF